MSRFLEFLMVQRAGTGTCEPLRERIFHRGLESRGQIMNPNVLWRTVTLFPPMKFLRIHLLALKLRKRKFNLPFSI